MRWFLVNFQLTNLLNIKFLLFLKRDKPVMCFNTQGYQFFVVVAIFGECVNLNGHPRTNFVLCILFSLCNLYFCSICFVLNVITLLFVFSVLCVLCVLFLQQTVHKVLLQPLVIGNGKEKLFKRQHNKKVNMFSLYVLFDTPAEADITFAV